MFVRLWNGNQLWIATKKTSFATCICQTLLVESDRSKYEKFEKPNIIEVGIRYEYIMHDHFSSAKALMSENSC